jgi:glycerol uptake facilitator-like aquaporin
MFGLAPFAISTNDRLTPPHFLSEVLATAILIVLIFVLARLGKSAYAPAAVAAYIGAAIFFTSSASFVNPTLTIARMLTDTFSGIAPGSVLGYISAQLIGALIGIGIVVLVTGKPPKRVAT